MMFNSGHFWNLEKDFYSESTNASPSNYNSYKEFITGSKVDSVLKNFEYEDPFNFVPSYGSSASVGFYSNINEFGDNYINSNQGGVLNRVALSLDLNFTNRGNAESERIINYIKSKEGGEKFIFQPTPNAGLSPQDAYKSLYSIQPYFAQEFSCDNIDIEHEYIDHNNISLSFTNEDYSQFSVRNLLRVNSMPQEKKDIIDDYSSRYHLDIEPSYTIKRDEPLHLTRFRFNSSRTHDGEGGVNRSQTNIELNYNGITDEILLKLLAFFYSKQGHETFTFTLKEPEEKTLNFFCHTVQHTYLFKNSNDLTVTLEEDYIRRRLNWGY